MGICGRCFFVLPRRPNRCAGSAQDSKDLFIAWKPSLTIGCLANLLIQYTIAC
jgi:hypothetical protein